MTTDPMRVLKAPAHAAARFCQATAICVPGDLGACVDLQLPAASGRGDRSGPVAGGAVATRFDRSGNLLRSGRGPFAIRFFTSSQRKHDGSGRANVRFQNLANLV